MKLLYITNGINGSGGLERVLSLKASYFVENYGYEVSILSLNNANVNPFYEFSPKIRFLSIDVKGSLLKYSKAYKKGIQKTINYLKPDIVAVCDDGLKAFFLPIIIKSDAKWIYERHVSKLIEERNGQNIVKKNLVRIKWMLMELLAKNYSRFVLLTEGNRKEWTSLKNVVVISNPLSFYPKEYSYLDSKSVICVGKISYQKGQDLLVKAWEKVYKKHSDWNLNLYGKENLEILNTKGLSFNINYFPPAKDIEQKYLQSSIYVMSSRFEGFGMVLTEAMACGVPCISFNCDYGPSDIICDGEDGFLVEKENVDQLAEMIIKVIEDNELRKRLGLHARDNVKKYEIKKIAAQWELLFKNI